MRNGKSNIPLVYILLGILWMALSDMGIRSISDHQEFLHFRMLNMVKGILFILFTGFLLYVMIGRERKKNLKKDRQYNDIYEKNPNPTWFYNPADFKFVSVNAAALASYGYTKKEFLSMTVLDIRPPEDADKLKSLYPRLEVGYHEAGMWRHLKKDGSLMYVSISSHQMILDDRPLVMVMAIDVTEKFLHEQELKQINAKLIAQKQQLDKNYLRLENMMQSINEGFFTINSHHIITHANTNFYTTTGVTFNAIGSRWEDVFPESKYTALYQQVTEAISLKKILKFDSFSVVLNKWLSLAVYPGEEETTVYFLDITVEKKNDIDRKVREAEYERQNEKLKVVSWLNSHQIRKPVASIIALSELMKLSDNQQEKDELLGLLCKCTLELDQIIHQINAETSGKSIK